MHARARRVADPARVDHAARPKIVARAVPPAVEHTTSVASEPVVSPGTPVRAAAAGAATRTDELGAILARSVAKRAHGASGTARQAGAMLQRFLGIGKKKKPPRPTQALPAPARPKQALPAPARPKQPLPPSAAGSDDMTPFEAREFNLQPEAPAGVAPTADVAPASGLEPDASGLVPVEGNPFVEWLVANFSSTPGVRKPLHPAQVRNLQIIASLKYPELAPEAPAGVAPRGNVARPVGVAPRGGGAFAPDLVPDESGLVPVKGDPYLEWLVSSYASNPGVMTPRHPVDLRNLQVIASLQGHPRPRGF
jgi:hypothetical protein